MKHELPELPYATDALEPHMSRETPEYHHGKHQATYIEKLNGLVKDTEFAEMSLNGIVMRAHGGIFNNAAQARNHAFFWQWLRVRIVPFPGRLVEVTRDTHGRP